MRVCAWLLLTPPKASHHHLPAPIERRRQNGKDAGCLANAVVASAAAGGGRPAGEVGQLLERLRAAAPSHPLVRDMDAAAAAFDAAAQRLAARA